MEATKDSFKNVLKKAQNLGYAEPSYPKVDLNGYDAMAKIRILSSLAFNKKISNFQKKPWLIKPIHHKKNWT